MNEKKVKSSNKNKPADDGRFIPVGETTIDDDQSLSAVAQDEDARFASNSRYDINHDYTEEDFANACISKSLTQSAIIPPLEGWEQRWCTLVNEETTAGIVAAHTRAVGAIEDGGGGFEPRPLSSIPNIYINKYINTMKAVSYDTGHFIIGESILMHRPIAVGKVRARRKAEARIAKSVNAADKSAAQASKRMGMGGKAGISVDKNIEEVAGGRTPPVAD